MLKGLIRCDTCGATLTLQSALHTPSLQCHNYARGNCHVSHGISVKKAEKAIIDYLEMAKVSGVFTIAEPEQKEVSEKEKDLNIILRNEKLKLERIKKAYQDGIDTLEEYKANKSAVLLSIERIEKSIEKQKKAGTKGTDLKTQRAIIQNKISDVLKVIKSDNISAAAKNEALRTIIKTITYNKSASVLEVLFHE